MRDRQVWPDLTRIEPDFLRLEKEIQVGEIRDYRQIDPLSFTWHGWDLISRDRLFSMILPFLKGQIERARTAMPEIYGESLSEVAVDSIHSPTDWARVPLLFKDDEPEAGVRGFRRTAIGNPLALKPRDAPGFGSMAFGSGGSQGDHTPTFVTLSDRAREVQAWRRGLDYHGLSAGDTVLYTYNTTHKGGQWMQESLLSHGVDVILRRPEEGPEQVLKNLRDYRANALFTVQQPYEAMLQQEKAAGINLHSLVQASLEDPQYHGILLPDSAGHRQVEFVFLGGFEIVPYALELVNEYLGGVPVATLLGSSEAIPQACSTNPDLTPAALCHNNNLHLLPGPHFIEVVKPEGDRWVPVRKGEEGWLVYTSWARDGTIWIRYAPGDLATWLLDEGDCSCGLFSPVIADVHRADARDRANLILHGCAAG